MLSQAQDAELARHHALHDAALTAPLAIDPHLDAEAPHQAVCDELAARFDLLLAEARAAATVVGSVL
ncbi:hypothetical protein ACQVP2_22490 [Methylobacterium aquaticum]|uniref:hypothetical protein n=1 Tax=Methylobacterium aquaticum TaxID=270351 RepID=UPI003D16C96E